MPHDLFSDAVVRPAPRRILRRTLTIFSIALHAFVISAIVVAQLLAVGPLPTPRSPLTYTVVHLGELPRIDVPAPPRVAPAAQASPTVSPNAAPLEPPDRIRDETGLENERVPSARPDIVVGVEGGSTGLLNGVVDGVRLPPPPPSPVPQTPIHLHSGIEPPRKIVDVTPMYPSLAQISRTQGLVILEATIDVRGNVTDVRVQRSIPLLDQAAVDAVKQWRYTPALLNGVPVPVIMSVTVRFALSR
jgi:protein TonB